MVHAHLVAGIFTPSVTRTNIKSYVHLVIYFDDSLNVVALLDKTASISYDDGVTWEPIEAMASREMINIVHDPLVKNRAFAVGRESEHFVTNDKGKTWSKFTTLDSKGKPLKDVDGLTVVPNAADPNLLLFRARSCDGWFGDFESCKYHHYYTSDGLKSGLKILTNDAEACTFAMATPEFAKIDQPATIFCSRVKTNSFGHVLDSQLLKTTDFFKTELIVDYPLLNSGKIIDLRVDKSFLLAVVQSDRYNEKSKVSVIISKDAITFDQSDLSFEVSSGAIIFLESSPLSLFLSVGKGLRHGRIILAEIHASDSTGLRYTTLLDNVAIGSTTKVQNVDGVWLANIIMDGDGSNKEEDSLMDDLFGFRHFDVMSKISLDNGRTWNRLAVLDDDSCKLEDDCSLHVADVNSFDAGGRYVTGPTPNILLASGTTGKHLGRYRQFKSYISRDGGISWRLVVGRDAVFSSGDQGNIIVAFPTSSRSGNAGDKLLYSLDQGKQWSEYKLDSAIYSYRIATTMDGTGSKFILVGQQPDNDSGGLSENCIIYAIDFSKAYDGAKCDKDKDFEKVYARAPEGSDGKDALCIYGHKESFMRRKPDSKCFVSTLFEDIKVNEEPCQCTEKDFECSPYFVLSPKGECIPDPAKISKLCKLQKKSTVTLVDKQLMAGNLCNSDKISFITSDTFTCKDYTENDSSENKIVSKLNEIEGTLSQYAYIETENELADNIVLRNKEGIVFASNNGGQSFVRVAVAEKVLGFMVGPVHGVVILIGSDEYLYYSSDGGNTFTKQKQPGPPALQVRPISFLPDEPHKFIWLSGDCGLPGASNCVAYHTDDSGKTFQKLISNAVACDYVSSVFDLSVLELIYCTVQEGNQRKLVSSTNLFKEKEPTILFDNIVSYAVRNNFVIVATIEPELRELRAKVTVDGSTFAPADFPSDFKVEAQTSYAILDSGMHSIFMHVTTVKDIGHERGAILKSNSNGTSYVLSLSDVNRNAAGFVDYDRMEGIEGVLLANTVHNPDSKDAKKLKTQISFNDGSQWSYLPPPLVDSEGKKYACIGGSLAKCSLNLHGFTERPDYRDTYSSTSAVGLLIGVGNVGETLDSYENAATFLSTDGGVTWAEIRKGVYQWEYGDQGTILVLVSAITETDEIVYSTDEGKSWQTYKFAEKPVNVLDLATIPTDTARQFVVFATQGDDSSKFLVYAIDFTRFFPRQCRLDLDNPDKDDYEYWSPKHPESAEGCLFGHEAKYLRRAIGHNDCFIGSAPLDKGYKVVRNCSCTRNDFECDYNYYRDSDGTCKLVKGLSPADHQAAMCSAPNTFEYFEPTGYRKIPLSTCVGGKSFDAFNPKPCPGHEKEFAKHYGRDFGSGKVLLVVLVPLIVFFSATWFVYEKGIRRNGGFQKLGQIRLDEDDDFSPIEENAVDVVVNKVVRGGIIVVAGAIAVVKTIRRLDRALLEGLTSSVFGRRPGRRNYVHVPDDEDELFGNFDNDYEDELEDGADVNFEVQDEPEEFTDFAEQPANADARLFDIDEQSDDGHHSSNEREAPN